MPVSIIFHPTDQILQEFIVREIVRIIQNSSREYSRATIDIYSHSTQMSKSFMDYFILKYKQIDPELNHRAGANNNQITFNGVRSTINFSYLSETVMRGRETPTYIFVLDYDKLADEFINRMGELLPLNSSKVYFHSVMNHFSSMLLDSMVQIHYNEQVLTAEETE